MLSLPGLQSALLSPVRYRIWFRDNILSHINLSWMWIQVVLMVVYTEGLEKTLILRIGSTGYFLARTRIGRWSCGGGPLLSYLHPATHSPPPHSAERFQASLGHLQRSNRDDVILPSDTNKTSTSPIAQNVRRVCNSRFAGEKRGVKRYLHVLSAM